jgi:hypothetical protein
MISFCAAQKEILLPAQKEIILLDYIITLYILLDYILRFTSQTTCHF